MLALFFFFQQRVYVAAPGGEEGSVNFSSPLSLIEGVRNWLGSVGFFKNWADTTGSTSVSTEELNKLKNAARSKIQSVLNCWVINGSVFSEWSSFIIFSVAKTRLSSVNTIIRRFQKVRLAFATRGTVERTVNYVKILLRW